MEKTGIQMPTVFGTPEGIRLHFRRWQKSMCCRHLAGGKQQSTGLLHLIVQIPSLQKNNREAKASLLFLARPKGFEPPTFRLGETIIPFF